MDEQEYGMMGDLVHPEQGEQTLNQYSPDRAVVVGSIRDDVEEVGKGCIQRIPLPCVVVELEEIRTAETPSAKDNPSKKDQRHVDP